MLLRETNNLEKLKKKKNTHNDSQLENVHHKPFLRRLKKKFLSNKLKAWTNQRAGKEGNITKKKLHTFNGAHSKVTNNDKNGAHKKA